MSIDRIVDLGGVVVLSVLLVWRLEARLSSVERKMSELCALLRAYLAAQKET